MNVQPINKTNSFRARFPKSDLNQLIKRADSTVAGMPKLYTMIDFLDKLPGKRAQFLIKEDNTHLNKVYTSIFDYTLRIDGRIVGYSAKDNWSALSNACIDDTMPQFGKHIHMPRSVFENKWWNNLNKTEEDIMKFAIDA